MLRSWGAEGDAWSCTRLGRQLSELISYSITRPDGADGYKSLLQKQLVEINARLLRTPDSRSENVEGNMRSHNVYIMQFLFVCII
jgi:hypothetical protein